MMVSYKGRRVCMEQQCTKTTGKRLFKILISLYPTIVLDIKNGIQLTVNMERKDVLDISNVSNTCENHRTKQVLMVMAIVFKDKTQIKQNVCCCEYDFPK